MTSATMSGGGGHEYKSDFFDYINAGSLASARRICPIVVGWLAPGSAHATLRRLMVTLSG